MWKGVQTEVLKVAASYAWKIVAAVIIVVVGLWLAKLVRKGIHGVLTGRNLDPTVVYFVDHSVQVLLYALIIIEAVHKLGVDSSSLVALGGR